MRRTDEGEATSPVCDIIANKTVEGDGKDPLAAIASVHGRR